MTISSTRRKIAAIAAGLAIAGTVGASAASLGGLGSDDLGADTGTTGSCETDGIELEYTTRYSTARGEYLLDLVRLDDIDLDCIGNLYSITIHENGGIRAFVDDAPLVVTRVRDRQPGPGVDLVGGFTLSARGITFPAESLEGVAVVIDGSLVP